jgi:hypothetical protein
MQDGVRILAECHNYVELIAAFRNRIAELGTTTEAADYVGGTAQRYCAKVLGPRQVRHLGPISLNALLGVLGVRLLVAADPDEDFARIRKRLTPTRHAGVRMLGSGTPRKRRHPFAGQSEFFKQLRRVQLLSQPRRRRRLIAKIAARARWSQRKAAASAANGAGDRP